MKVLIVHVPYEHHGGEDVHVEALSEGYTKIGVEAVLYPKVRNQYNSLLIPSLLSLAPTSIFRSFEEAWKKEKPDYIHLHNIFSVLGPRFLRWGIEKKIKMVMTVHNHRFFCTNGLALREKKICKDCFNSKIAWRPILYNCNHDLKKSIYHSLALTQIRLGDLYKHAIQQFIAPSPYLQNELIRLGIPKNRVVHILNPVFTTGTPKKQNNFPNSIDVIYAGRLSQEKGIYELLRTVKLLPHINFVIAGDGPERNLVESAVESSSNLCFLGALPHESILELIDRAKIAVLPSICNETLSTFALEAFFQGKRCIVPKLDSTSWLAFNNFPGYLANPGDPAHLAKTIQETVKMPPISTERKQELQKQLGFDRFCDDLKLLINEMKKPWPN